jgi:ABC-2 type transport system permease protein
VSRFAAVALAVATRQVRGFVKNPALFLPSLAFPLFFFVAFAGGLSRIGDVPGFDYPPGYTAFQYVFVLLQTAAFGGVFTGFAMARDFERGFARRLFLAAPHRGGILAGAVLGALARFAVTGTLVTIVALAAGMQVGGDGVDLFGLALLAALVNLAGTLWAAGIATRFRSFQAAPAMQVPVFLTLFLAPVYVPVDLLAGWVETVARVNPLTPVLTAGRALLAGRPEDLGAAYAAAGALVAVLAVWAALGLRRAERAGA